MSLPKNELDNEQKGKRFYRNQVSGGGCPVTTAPKTTKVNITTIIKISKLELNKNRENNIKA